MKLLVTGGTDEAGAEVQICDPEAMKEALRIYGNRDDLTLRGTTEAALKDANALVTVTSGKNSARRIYV